MVSDETFRPYMRVIRRRLRCYRRHPGWEDILSAAYVAVFKALEALPEDEQLDAVGLALTTANNAASSWLRSPENPLRDRTRHGRPLSYQAVWLPDFFWVGGEERQHQVHWRLVEPDFAPALIERLWASEVCEQARRALPPSEWAALWSRCREALNEEAGEMGCSVNCAAVRAARGVKRARRMAAQIQARKD
jgi:hypothetical protein